MDAILTTIISTSGAAFVNFLATKIYNKATGSSKNYFWKNKKQDLMSFKTPIQFEELKKRTRIVVIDDEESFPLKYFVDEGYSVEKWDKVTNYGKLESGFYDIIVLDIQGVAQDISEDDGIGVLEHLKKHNPAQIIIAYSQHSYDLTKSKFFELADERITKPSDFLKMKKIIDNLIHNKFKPDRYISTLHQILQNNHISEREINKIDFEIAKSIKNKSTPDWKMILSSSKSKTELVSQIIAIGNTILKFFQ